jgi:hypothetical protein
LNRGARLNPISIGEKQIFIVHCAASEAKEATLPIDRFMVDIASQTDPRSATAPPSRPIL